MNRDKAAATVCVNGKKDDHIFEESTEAYNYLYNSIDSNLYVKKVGASGAAEVGKDYISSQMKAEFERENSASSRMISFVWRGAYIAKTQRFDLQQNDSMKPNYSFAKCGDHYIDKISYGTEIKLYMSLTFDTNAEREKFSTDSEGKIKDIGSLKASFKSLESIDKSNITISMKTDMKGGNLEGYSRVLKEHNVTSCTFKDYQLCAQFINAILEYATSNLSKDAMTSTSQIEKSIYPYPELKHSTKEIDKIKNNLKKTFNSHFDLDTRLSTRINSRAFSGGTLARLKNHKANLQIDIMEIQNVLRKCDSLLRIVEYSLLQRHLKRLKILFLRPRVFQSLNVYPVTIVAYQTTVNV